MFVFSSACLINDRWQVKISNFGLRWMKTDSDIAQMTKRCSRKMPPLREDEEGRQWHNNGGNNDGQQQEGKGNKMQKAMKMTTNGKITTNDGT
ncbi:hypothetical protein niasHT_034317 [Heterodera trifolii]|uniref:Uncharacterized protein n=1 Tax=Heterodera trifolii TaxID=157864 RepID=A0ABD2HRT1_9BILA